MSLPSSVELFEKMIRAKVKLEALKRPHGDRCIVELDPESTAICNCGAMGINVAIQSIIEDLTVQKK